MVMKAHWGHSHSPPVSWLFGRASSHSRHFMFLAKFMKVHLFHTFFFFFKKQTSLKKNVNKTIQAKGYALIGPVSDKNNFLFYLFFIRKTIQNLMNSREGEKFYLGQIQSPLFISIPCPNGLVDSPFLSVNLFRSVSKDLESETT